MQLNLTSAGKGTTKAIEISDSVFGCKYNEALIHQVVTAHLAAARQGTRAQKTRSEVSGGGKKPWKQKGTGQARAGTIRSPLWRKGGVTFAAKPQDHSVKVNRKMYRGAMRAIYSELIRQGRLLVVDSFNVTSHKTKELVTKLHELKLDSKTLIVLDMVDENLYKAARNLHNIDIYDVDAAAADPVSMIRYTKILLTVPALRKIEEKLA